MVIDDVDRPYQTRLHLNKKSSRATHEAYIASPVDRLAAFMADLVLFLPILTLCLAPIKREVLLAQIAGDNQKLLLLGLGGTLAAALFLIFYQTVLIGLFGTTPGKRFLGLRVVNIWSKTKPDFFSAFVRSAFWVLSLLTLGVPWLAIFSNSHRRPLHDRAADTLIIVADRSRAARSPGLVETSMINGLNAAIITFSLLVSSLVIQSYVHENKDVAGAIVSSGEMTSQRCEQVTSAATQWLGTEAEAPSRMQIALALHAGERIDDECLESEVTMNFLEERELHLSYLAKAIIKRDDEEQFADYLEKTCENSEKNHTCGLLEDIQSNGREPVELIADAPTYYRIWAIRLNLERGFAQAALAQLQVPAPHMDLAYYFSLKRLQAKLEVKRETDVSQDFLSSLDGLNREERILLARETCLAETQLGCGQQKLSCSKLLEFATSFKAEHELSFENPQTVLSITRAVRCENDPELYEKLNASIDLPVGRSLLQAFYQSSRGKKKEALKYINSLSKEKDFADFRAEALALRASISEKSTELDSLSSDWAELDKTSQGYRTLGWALEEAYMKLSDYPRAFEVGLQLKAAGVSSLALQKNLVLAAYESEQVEAAREYLSELDTLEFGQAVNDRMPASSEEKVGLEAQLQKIVELLREPQPVPEIKAYGFEQASEAPSERSSDKLSEKLSEKKISEEKEL